MYITVIDEKSGKLTSWSVYSTNLEKLVIPRIGETIRIIGGEYFVVVDVTYDISYSLSGYSPTEIRIRVKKKEENEQPKYE